MGQLEVIVVEGRNFQSKDRFSENDVYVKIYLDKKSSEQRSQTIANSNNPQWNEAFVFNHLNGEDILHVDIYDQDSMKDDKIGSIEIDLYHQGYIDHWFDIPPKVGFISDGQIHLILHYQTLQI